MGGWSQSPGCGLPCSALSDSLTRECSLQEGVKCSSELYKDCRAWGKDRTDVLSLVGVSVAIARSRGEGGGGFKEMC